ncbi:hypothetical protein AB4Z27_15490 [Cupriavidus sp. KB_39]|uniref:hypothetical protein n=1 Tax=Cupriavidus sp. KB_39 TaxID=3233036 RepID=UPI003F91401E
MGLILLSFLIALFAVIVDSNGWYSLLWAMGIEPVMFIRFCFGLACLLLAIAVVRAGIPKVRA